MKAHDVRHLTICDHCKTLGDRRRMIELGTWIGVMHGRCAIEAIGIDAATADAVAKARPA